MKMRRVITNIGVGLAALGLCLQFAMVNPQPAAAASYCGSACNGKAPSYNNCSSSAVQVAQGHPKASYRSVDSNGYRQDITEYDTRLLVRVMYSTSCETLWAVVSNLRSFSRLDCDAYMVRTYYPVWNNVPVECPVAGTSVTTKMVDDHHPSYGIAAKAEVREKMHRTTCSTSYGGDGSLCKYIDYETVVEFRYTFYY